MSEDIGPSRAQATIKRSFDLLVALVLLLLTGSFIVAALIAVRLTTRQPGLFRQSRVGCRGELFTIYKIRTMSLSTDASTVTTSTDIRITKIGRLLRRFKLDELPQLLNVVRGDMSLVGPRPDVPGFADLLDGPDRVVLTMRPGITGPATLHFRQEEALLGGVADPETYNRLVVYPQKVALNRHYVENYSFRRDLHCIGETLRQMAA